MGDKGSQPSTSLESGRHFPLAPRRVGGPLWEWAGGKGGLRASPPSSAPASRLILAGGPAAKQCICRRQPRAECCICGRLEGGQGAHSQIEWEGDNLFLQSGRAGFHGCVFIPEQAHLPKALTPPTPPAGSPWLLLIEKKTMRFGFLVS